jgi:pimeloyl-ACP methyl ester carboxylesterase
MAERAAPVDVHPDDLTWGHSFGNGADGVSLHYVLHGRGRTVLLLHGWPGFWYDWRHVIPRLPVFEAAVVAPDFRGFGDSDRPDLPPTAGYTPEVFARDLLALLDQMGAQQVVIGAYDIGAEVAQVLARLAPDRVRALALFNPPYPGIGDRSLTPDAQHERWYQHFHAVPTAEEIIGYGPDTVRAYLGHFYEHWMGRKQALRPAEFDAIVSFYARPGAVQGSIAYHRALAATQRWEALASPTDKIVQPTIVLWGDADPVMPVAWGDRLEEYFEHLTLKILPGVGHFVPIEAPDEAAAAILSALRAAREVATGT